MKFYFVGYGDDSCPEGCAGEYFKTKKEGERFLRKVWRDARAQRTTCDCGRELKPEESCDQCGNMGPSLFDGHGEPELEVIELKGTARQMAWQALHHQIVS